MLEWGQHRRPVILTSGCRGPVDWSASRTKIEIFKKENIHGHQLRQNNKNERGAHPSENKGIDSTTRTTTTSSLERNIHSQIDGTNFSSGSWKVLNARSARAGKFQPRPISPKHALPCSQNGAAESENRENTKVPLRHASQRSRIEKCQRSHSHTFNTGFLPMRWRYALSRSWIEELL